MKKKIQIACVLLIIFMISGTAIYFNIHRNRLPKQILYSTDLSVDGDFDDYFDLAALHALNNSLKPTIIVDGNNSGSKQTGVAAIHRLAEAVGWAGVTDTVIVGRDDNLSAPDDSRCSMELVNALEQAGGGIDVVTVGSLRDIAALYNHSPALFEKKVENIYVFAGDAEGTYAEYNVELDETAFLRIMNSGLNIYWIPCFQSGLFTAGNRTSYMQIPHSEIFQDTDPKLLNWFLYRFEMENTDFEKWSQTEHDTTEFMKDIRNIWCAPLFPLLNGSMESYLQKYNETYHENMELPFGFSEQRVTFQENGAVVYGQGQVIHVFEVYNQEEYLKLSKYIMQTMFGQNIIYDGEKYVKEQEDYSMDNQYSDSSAADYLYRAN